MRKMINNTNKTVTYLYWTTNRYIFVHDYR